LRSLAPMSDRTALTRTRLLVVTGGCALALGLTACGGDDGDDAEALREEFTAGLVEAAEADTSLTDEQRSCLQDELTSSITDDMLAEASETGEMTPEMTQAAMEAGIACQK
jgi:hypothetical protein